MAGSSRTILDLILIFLICQVATVTVNTSRKDSVGNGCLLIESELENGVYVDTDGNHVESFVKRNYIIEARCNLGFGLRGHKRRRCQGKWRGFTEEAPVCEDVDECLNKDLLGSEDSYSSEPSKDEWSYSELSVDMLQVEWSRLPQINCHAWANCINTLGSYRCECEKGFQGDGVNYCEKMKRPACTPLTAPSHGSMTKHGKHEVRFQCDKGYQIFGARTRECVDGRWNGLQPVCQVKGCGDPGTPVNGSKYGDDYEVGYSVFFGCNDGFELITGQSERVCLQSGNDYWSEKFWSGVQPECRPKANSLLKIAQNIQTDFIDRLEVFSHSGRGRLAVIDNIGLDLVFAYDTSTSINHVNFERGVKFTQSLLEQFGVSNDTGGTRVGVITFSDFADVAFTYGPEVDTLEKVVQRLHMLKDNLGGGTNIGDALGRVFDLINNMRNGSKRALFLMTDGLANIGEDPAAIAESLRRDEEVEIFVVAIGEGINQRQVRKIASQPYSTHVFLLKNFEDLEELTGIISEKGAEYKRCGQAGNLELPNNDDQSEHNANPKAWPWLAQILTHNDGEWTLQCGGALLCEQWVITAGTCVFNNTNFRAMHSDALQVRLGAYELGVHEATEQSFRVSEVHIHQEFDLYNRYNDIALIKLNRSANLTSSVRTLCVPSVATLRSSSTRCYTAGWGIVEPIKDEIKDENSSSVFLKQLRLGLIDDDDCRERMTHPFRFVDHKMCAGKRFVSHEACRGDTGGPLVCRQIDGSYAIMGVGSYTKECTDFEKYGVYTRVSEFTPWLHGVIGNCTLAYQAVAVGGL